MRNRVPAACQDFAETCGDDQQKGAVLEVVFMAAYCPVLHAEFHVSHPRGWSSCYAHAHVKSSHIGLVQKTNQARRKVHPFQIEPLGYTSKPTGLHKFLRDNITVTLALQLQSDIT
jgi:hypothetical protein